MNNKELLQKFKKRFEIEMRREFNPTEMDIYGVTVGNPFCPPYQENPPDNPSVGQFWNKGDAVMVWMSDTWTEVLDPNTAKYRSVMGAFLLIMDDLLGMGSDEPEPINPKNGQIWFRRGKFVCRSGDKWIEMEDPKENTDEQ